MAQGLFNITSVNCDCSQRNVPLRRANVWGTATCKKIEAKADFEASWRKWLAWAKLGESRHRAALPRCPNSSKR
jgi:hypothetical protein